VNNFLKTDVKSINDRDAKDALDILISQLKHHIDPVFHIMDEHNEIFREKKKIFLKTFDTTKRHS